jgi:hypothetical protein
LASPFGNRPLRQRTTAEPDERVKIPDLQIADFIGVSGRPRTSANRCWRRECYCKQNSLLVAALEAARAITFDKCAEAFIAAKICRLLILDPYAFVQIRQNPPLALGGTLGGRSSNPVAVRSALAPNLADIAIALQKSANYPMWKLVQRRASGF